MSLHSSSGHAASTGEKITVAEAPRRSRQAKQTDLVTCGRNGHYPPSISQAWVHRTRCHQSPCCGRRSSARCRRAMRGWRMRPTPRASCRAAGRRTG